MKNKILFFGLLSLIMLFGCRNDSITDGDTTIEIPAPDKNIVSSVSGRVINDDNIAVKDVLVTLGSTTSTTDENGYYRLSDVKINVQGSVMTFKSNDYFDNYKFAYPESNQTAHVNVKMLAKTKVGDFNQNDAASFEFDGGAKVIFDEASVSKADGSAYTGNVNVYAHWYDPNDLDILNSMPGDLRALNALGENVQLATFGMIAVELFSDSGEALQITEGKDATLEFPLTGNVLSEAPSDIPLWSLDELTGVWKEEGVAVMVGNKYEAKVSHFSFWNCDVPYPLVNITGRFLDQNGQAIQNHLVNIVHQNTSTTAYSYTNADGSISGKVPKDEDLKLTLYGDCDFTLFDLHTQDISASSVDIDLGDVTVDIAPIATLIEGLLLDCNGAPLTNGYLMVTVGNAFYILESDGQGMVSTHIPNCGSSEIILQAFNLTDNEFSDTMNFTLANPTENFGTLTACGSGSTDEYVILNFQGVITPFDEDYEAYLVDGTRTVIFSSGPSTRYIEASIATQVAGTMEPTYVRGRGLESTGTTSFYCSSDAVDRPCDLLTMTITETGGVGDFIVGSITGMIYEINGSTTAEPFEVNFKIEIEDSFNSATLSGKVWEDTNSDGLQDIGEPDVEDISISVRRPGGARVSGVPFHFVESQSDGSYSFEGLFPDVEYNLNFFAAKTPTLKNAGPADIDNDFAKVGPETGETDFILLSEGQNKDDVDLGLLEGFPLNCTVTVGNCGADSDVYVWASGGVQPYSYELNGLVTTNNYFTGLGTGIHSGIVIDANGTTCDFSFIIEDNETSVSGIVWADKPGGADNLYDDGIDELLAGQRVLISTPSSTISIETDSDGFYDFGMVGTGSYTIMIIDFVGYELLQPDFGNDDSIDSDLGPGALLNSFTIDNCDQVFDIDIGLKEL